jgi:uncharacterized protein YbaR (Trm112 family)
LGGNAAAIAGQHLKARPQSATLVGFAAPHSSRLVAVVWGRRLTSDGERSLMSEDLLSMLRCPENGSALASADRAVLARLNAAIDAGDLKNRAGGRLEKRMDGGLVRADGDVLYPIIDQIPILLRDEGIVIT